VLRGKTGRLFILASAPVPGVEFKEQILHRFDLSTRQTDKLLEGVSAFALSDSGEKMLSRQGDRWAIVSTGQAPKSDEGKLNLDDLQVWVDPRARRRGYARRALADLCRLLLEHVPAVCLFVRPENKPALGLYDSIGMTRELTYRSLVF